MIGITDIVAWTPPDSIDNVLQAENFGEDAAFATERIGARKLPVIGDDVETSDLAVNAINALIEKSNLDPQSVDFLMVCTQNPDGSGLPHTSAAVQTKAGLPQSVAAFDISLGCSGYVYGLHAARGFMDSAQLKTGIFVTADPYSKIIDRTDRTTSMLFGDSATATLLTHDPVFELGAALFATDGSGGDNIINRDGRLEMNGRQVFNFANSKVPKQINALLEGAGVDKDEIDLFLLHQGSRFMIETLIKRLKLPAEKAPIALEETGNTVSSSIPLMLTSHLRNSAMKRILISGFGVGLSWGSSILERKR